MNPWNWFDEKYFINLDFRTERLLHTIDQFINVGLENPTRIPGTLVNTYKDKYLNACRGNHLSHAKCMRDAIKRGYTKILIFEDDVQFFPEATENLQQSLIELPHDWDMLFLGINMDQYYAWQISDHIAKLDGGFSTHAYAVRNSLYKELIELNENPDILHNDVAYATEIMPNYNCYVTIPLIAGQVDGYSDIMGRHMSSNEMFQKRFEERLKRVDN